MRCAEPGPRPTKLNTNTAAAFSAASLDAIPGLRKTAAPFLSPGKAGGERCALQLPNDMSPSPLLSSPHDRLFRRPPSALWRAPRQAQLRRLVSPLDRFFKSSSNAVSKRIPSMVSEPDATIQAAAADEISSPIAFKPGALQRVAVTAAVLRSRHCSRMCQRRVCRRKRLAAWCQQPATAPPSQYRNCRLWPWVSAPSCQYSSQPNF